MDNKDFQTVFTWLKSLGGYDWEDCKFAGNEMYLEGNSVIVPTRPYLVERDCSQEIEAYKPFDDITLFGNFADIDAIPDSYLLKIVQGVGYFLTPNRWFICIYDRFLHDIIFINLIIV